MVRQGDDGYRIPSPAEDDWERQRAGIAAKAGGRERAHAEAVAEPLAAAAVAQPSSTSSRSRRAST